MSSEKMNHKSYELTDAILKSFPDEAIGPILVTYKGGDTSGLSIAQGYMIAAEKLGNTLDKTGMDAGEDLMAFPLLFLIRHSVEMSLKAYLIALNNHRATESCSNIRDIDKSSLSKHPLVPIYSAIHNAIRVDRLHSDNETFISFKRFVFGLDSLDLSSESLRYSRSRDGVVSIFFHEQRYVAVERLLHISRKFTDFIRYCVENETLSLCEAGTFLKQNVVSYKNAKNIIDLTEDPRGKLIKTRRNPEIKEDFFSIRDLAEVTSLNRDVEQIFRDEIRSIMKSFSIDQMANLALTIEIIKGHDSGLGYFISSGEEFTNTYVSNNLMQLGSPIARERVLEYVDKLLKLKQLWRPPRKTANAKRKRA